MGDRPIGDGADGLEQVRDETVPREVDGFLDVVRGDMENIRRLVAQAGSRADLSLVDLDEAERHVMRDVGLLGDEVGAALSGVIDELRGLSRPAHGGLYPASGGERAVVYVSGLGGNDAGVRRSPPANSVIVVDDAFVYTTDGLGRVTRAEATLTAREPGRRNKYAQRTLKGKLPGDDAGHLIARVLGGLGDQLNLVPMTRKVNREEYAAMERRWRRAVEQGKTVDLKVMLDYDDNARRPATITVTYQIAGQRRRKVKLHNTAPEEPE